VPTPAWVMVDRSFQLPSKFPVFGYGTTTKSPYVWPGAKDNGVEKGRWRLLLLPADLRPTLLLAACPAGMMRPAGPAVLPGQKGDGAAVRSDQRAACFVERLQFRGDSIHDADSLRRFAGTEKKATMSDHRWPSC